MFILLLAIFLGQQLISIPEAARLCRVHISTVWRWTSRGVRGVKLGVIKLGGKKTFTSAEELEKFVEATTVARGGQSTPATRTSKQRRRQLEAAERVLDRLRIGTARVSDPNSTKEK